MTHDDRAPDDEVVGDTTPDQVFEQPLAILSRLGFLRPDSYDLPESPAEPMPASTWERIETALATESLARVAAAEAASEPDDRAVDAATDAATDAEIVSIDAARGSRSTYRWAGGLVAASLAIVVGGLVVTSMRTTTTSDSGAVVAAVALGTEQNLSAGPVAELAEASAAGDPVASAAGASVPAPLAASAAADSGALTKAGGAGWIQPARLVLASGTDYTPTGLGTQVTDLLDSVGVDDADEARAMPVQTALALVGDKGFTASVSALRECVTALTSTTQSQALVVDRATYQGSDAGVVVAPTYSGSATVTSPPPTTTVASDMGELDVWVVNPDCSVVDPSVMIHALHHWAN